MSHDLTNSLSSLLSQAQSTEQQISIGLVLCDLSGLHLTFWLYVSSLPGRISRSGFLQKWGVLKVRPEVKRANQITDLEVTPAPTSHNHEEHLPMDNRITMMNGEGKKAEFYQRRSSFLQKTTVSRFNQHLQYSHRIFCDVQRIG